VQPGETVLRGGKAGLRALFALATTNPNVTFVLEDVTPHTPNRIRQSANVIAHAILTDPTVRTSSHECVGE